MQVTGSSANNSGGGAAPGAGGGGAASTSQNGTAPPQGNGTGVEAGRVGLTPRAAARLRVRMLPYLCHKASQVCAFRGHGRGWHGGLVPLIMQSEEIAFKLLLVTELPTVDQ